VSAPRCTVVLAVSRRFIGLMVLVHGSAALVPWWLGLQPALAAVLCAGVVFAGGWQIALHAGWARHERLDSLELVGDGRARLQRHGAAAVDATLCEVPFTNRVMTLLAFQTRAGRRLVAMVWADACQPGQYRRLRVFVRWAGWRQAGARDSARSDALS